VHTLAQFYRLAQNAGGANDGQTNASIGTTVIPTTRFQNRPLFSCSARASLASARPFVAAAPRK
jgi:hypothetical protein